MIIPQNYQPEEMLRLNRSLQAISQCNQALIHTFNEMELLQKICSIMVESGGYRMAWVGYAENDDAKSVRPVTQAGFEEGYLDTIKVNWADVPLGHGPTGTAIRTGQPFTMRNLQTNKKFKPWLHEASKRGYRSIQCLPLKIGKDVIGAITIYSEIDDAFDAEETVLLTALADNMAYGITMLRIRKAREKAEEGLIEQQKRFSQALEAAQAGVWEWDLKTGKNIWSDEIWKLYGLERGEQNPSYKLWLSTVHPDDKKSIIQKVADAVKKNISTNIEYRVNHPDGSVRWLMTRGMPLLDDSGHAVRYIGTIIDITERKLLEEERANLQVQLQQAQKMKLVGQLAGGIAHDFNNMLTVILGHTEMALDKADSTRNDLEAIEKAANHSADLTRQLLAFARKQDVVVQIIDLNVSVEKMLSILTRLIGENITLNWIPKAPHPLIKIDPSQIEQILANLCINARDAIEGIGNITIETDKIHVDPTGSITDNSFTIPGDYVTLAITDNGHGIEKKHLPYIFEPFFTTREVSKGTGMGLAMVYGIVKQCYGFIKVKSTEGKGTTIIIYLPLEQEAAAAEPAKPAKLALPFGKSVILLVEDQPDILQLCKQMLGSSGLTVLAADSPKEAIQRAEQYKDTIDLLVTDVIMPEMNGSKLFKKLQRICPHLKVLYMSGYTADLIVNNIENNEGMNFIGKPFSMNAFANAIQKALKTSKPHSPC